MFITVLNEIAKVMFLHLSVCPQGVSASMHARIPPTPPPPARSRHPQGTDFPPPPPQGADPSGSRPPRHQEQTPPGADPTPPPNRRLLLRTVRILLEYILVYFRISIIIQSFLNLPVSPAGDISMGDILTVQPFSNTVDLVELQVNCT